ncbi:hypothetical protein N7510_001198 [Penicillium lagena]|uniref:uncharacterized protein n=1 Tax=Penicillium lagena TaxID=94218 RepID=UPI002540CDEE|nr:uncharacterized protein N7510_001198 [Penicillium lagena]KAJ5624889.1 hypothetical protein N7510_001198 [Penicillium lagena]
MKPSPMQDLLSQAAIIPSVLEQIDHLPKAPYQASTSNVGTIIDQLVDVLSRLEKWEVTLRQKIVTLPHWPVMRDSESDLSSPKKPALWFPNVTIANVYIHLWAFQIICLDELEKLVSWFPSLISKKSISSSGIKFGHIQEDIFQLSGQTCSSMEYLLQDKMKLYGPASTIFPLQTVYHKIKHTGPQQENNIARIEATVDRLVQKGLLSAPTLVFGANSA